MCTACITYWMSDRLCLISYLLGYAYCPALYLHRRVLHGGVLHRKTDTHILANEFADMIRGIKS